MVPFFVFSVPTKIVYQAGIASDFSAELDLIPVQKYFVITDKILKDLKVIDPVIQAVINSGREVVGVFSDVPPDSGVAVIEKCAELARASGAEGIIAIGGGSVLDTAKGCNILFSLGGNLIDDYSGAQTITQDLRPLIAIPTTAGTGSEVTEAIVVLDESTSTKLSFVDRHLLPTMALLDPELTVGLPQKTTAATGLDALTHAMEAVMSVQRGPVSDALALQAIKIIFKSLVEVVKNSSDVNLRGEMLVASTLAGMAFNHAMVGVVHSVAHTLGGLFHLHHGTANGIFLPYGLEYNLESSEAEIASMAASVGIKIQGSPRETAQSVILAVKNLLKELNKTCGIAISLKDAGIPEDKLGLIAERAPDDGSSFYSPTEVTAEKLLPLLQKAYLAK